MALGCGLLFACTAPTRIVVSENTNTRPRQQPQPQQPVQYNPQPEQQETTYQVFYDELSPYGSWVDYPGMAMCGRPGCRTTFSRILPMAIGYTAMNHGPGCPITNGVGPRSIMAGGFMKTVWMVMDTGQRMAPHG